MKKVFFANKQWNNAQYFATANIWLASVLFFILGFHIKNLPFWATESIGLLSLFILFVLVRLLIGYPIRIELNTSSFAFYFPLGRTKKYNFSEVRLYATASFGGRGSYCHSVVLEFTDGNRIQIPSVKFDGYKEFIQFLQNNNFAFFGYIGQNNWRRKNRPLSTKWVVARYEKELEKEIDKKSGIIFLYFTGIFLLVMNVVVLYTLIFTI